MYLCITVPLFRILIEMIIETMTITIFVYDILGATEHVLGGCYEPCLCMPVCIILYLYYKGEIFLSLYSILYLCELGGRVLGRCYSSGI